MVLPPFKRDRRRWIVRGSKSNMHRLMKAISTSRLTRSPDLAACLAHRQPQNPKVETAKHSLFGSTPSFIAYTQSCYPPHPTAVRAITRLLMAGGHGRTRRRHCHSPAGRHSLSPFVDPAVVLCSLHPSTISCVLRSGFLCVSRRPCFRRFASAVGASFCRSSLNANARPRSRVTTRGEYEESDDGGASDVDPV